MSETPLTAEIDRLRTDLAAAKVALEQELKAREEAREEAGWRLDGAQRQLLAERADRHAVIQIIEQRLKTAEADAIELREQLAKLGQGEKI